MADLKEQTGIKNVIYSILVSCPMRLTIMQLCKDYLDLEGRPIPVEQLGFRNVEDYLRSMPEMVQVWGSGGYAQLEVCVNKNSQHINRMVLNQKRSKSSFFTTIPPKTRNVNLPRNSVSVTQQNTPNRIPKTCTPLPVLNSGTIPPLMSQTPKFEPGFPYYNFCKSFTENKQTLSTELNLTTPITSDPAILQIEQRAPIKFQLKKTSKCAHLIDQKETADLTKDKQMETTVNKQKDIHVGLSEIKQVSSNQQSADLPETKLLAIVEKLADLQLNQSCNNNIINNLEESTVSSCSSSTLKNTSISDDYFNHSCRIPKRVQTNLRELIQLWPRGIECTRVPDEYRKLFKRKICYNEYGYHSIIEMCSDLPDIFHYTQLSTEDYILYDINIPIPPILLNADVSNTFKISEKVGQGHILDELKKIGQTSLMLPSDVMGPGDGICRFWPNNVCEGDIFDIEIGEIYDLSKFWIYFIDQGLEKLMKDIQAFFQHNYSRYTTPEAILEEGLYCVATYVNMYHRCVIVNMLADDPGMVRVLFIDYGTVSNIQTDSIWYLPKEFSTLPAQAVRARLSNIYPTYENQPWPQKAHFRFQEMVSNRVLVADVTVVDETNHTLELYLADITVKENIFYLNDVLVKEKLAVYNPDQQIPSLVDPDCLPTVRYIHLYPEFYEIESGLAPSPSDMQYIYENNIPLHHFMPQYFNLYFYEDINAIILTHEKFNQKKTLNWRQYMHNDIEEDDFDCDFFPEEIREEIFEIYKRTNGSEDENAKAKSAREYSCSKKRLSDLMNSSSSSSSDVLQSWQSTTNQNNPFLKSTNPFHPSNNQLTENELSESQRRYISELFARASLQESSTGRVAVTQPNNAIISTSNPLHNELPRVRTPPGFASQRIQVNCDYALQNPYYNTPIVTTPQYNFGYLRTTPMYIAPSYQLPTQLNNNHLCNYMYGQFYAPNNY